MFPQRIESNRFFCSFEAFSAFAERASSFSVCAAPKETAEEVVESAKKITAPENVITDLEKRFGSDNFADYSRKAPGTYVHVGSSDNEKNNWPHHNEHFDLAKESLAYAAALALQYSLDYLNKSL